MDGPSVTTSQGRVRVSDVSAPSISDTSDGAFSVTNLPPVFINEYLPHPYNAAGRPRLTTTSSSWSCSTRAPTPWTSVAGR